LAQTQPPVPFPLANIDVPAAVIRQAFSRIDELGLGVAFAVVWALYVFVPTVWVVANGKTESVPTFQLLGQYFVGYAVTWAGAVVGAFYGSVFGFVLGWSAAYLRNRLLKLYLYIAKVVEELRTLEEP